MLLCTAGFLPYAQPAPYLDAPATSCFFALPLLGQNPGSQATPQPGGITGLTIHTNNGQQQTIPAGPPPTKNGVIPALAEANQLFSQSKIPEAAAKYQAIVKADPKIVPAQVGDAALYLIMQKLDEAQSAAKAAIAALPNSPPVLTMAADVQFRLASIPEVRALFVKAQNINANDPELYIGLSRVYKAESLYRRAYDNLKRAHEVAPDNGPVQCCTSIHCRSRTRSRSWRVYLAKPNLNPQIARALQSTGLSEEECVGAGSCMQDREQRAADRHQAEPVSRAGTKLGGVGLNVKINKQDVHLALDTGATGILLGRAASDKLGLQRLGYQPIVGVGDAGMQGGFTALAQRIRIGDLEFQDCVVKVTDAATPVTGQDGLIGSDVFSSYLIDIDVPWREAASVATAKRPNEAGQSPALETMSSDQGPKRAATTLRKRRELRRRSPIFPKTRTSRRR